MLLFYGKRKDKLGTLVFKDNESKEILIWKHIESELVKDYKYLKDELLYKYATSIKEMDNTCTKMESYYFTVSYIF